MEDRKQILDFSVCFFNSSCGDICATAGESSSCSLTHYIPYVCMCVRERGRIVFFPIINI